MHRVLVVDDLHPSIYELLSAKGFECINGSGWEKCRYADVIAEYEGLIVRTKIKVDKPFIDKAANLKFIARAGAGMENIDVAYAQSKGITCLSSPEGNRDSVAEHCVGVLLAMMNNIVRADKQVKQGYWHRDANWGVELQGKKVGIIGYGYMGEAFAKRLAGFGVEVLAYDKYKQGFSNGYVVEATMQQLFNEADIVSLHIPLTEETHYLANEVFFNSFKKPIFFINTSRGKNVNTADLVKAMQTGKVRGAALDVLEYEAFSFEDLNADSLPEPFKYLANHEHVILTPHIAGWTAESYRKHSEVLAAKIFKLYNS